MNGNEKKVLIWFIGVIVIMISLIIAIISHLQAKNEQELAAAVEEPMITEGYEPFKEPILLSTEAEADPYQSLYGIGGNTFDSEMFTQVCLNYFTGPETATQDELVNEIVKMRNLCRAGDFAGVISEFHTFGVGYSLPDNEFGRELAQICFYASTMKDLPILSDNSQIMEIRSIVDGIKDPELYLLATMNISCPYIFYLNEDSICLDSILGINGCGTVLKEGDSHYQTANTTLGEEPLALYLFSIRYNQTINLNAYIVTDQKGVNHVLSIENEDGSFTSPFESQTGHVANKNGQYDDEIIEYVPAPGEDTSETSEGDLQDSSSESSTSEQTVSE